MFRTVRWRFYSRRQREIALATIAGTSALGFTAFHHSRPLQADSETSWLPLPWRSKPVISDRASVSERAEKEPARSDAQPPQVTNSPQAPPRQTKGHETPDFERDFPEENETTWHNAASRLSALSDAFTGWDMDSLRTKMTRALPSWIRILPVALDKLQKELSGAPYSLSWEIWEDAHDPEVNPEIIWDAEVRLADSLCPAEDEFRRLRRKHTTRALAKYLDVPESDVHPDDVPVIALCGSGGGLRALVAGASSSLCAQESGLFDCVTYTAGVSGSCWLQTMFNSSIGQQDYQRIIDHLKHRLGVHIAYPPAALNLLITAPTNKFLLQGFVEKMRGVPNAEYGLVDIYGLLLAARLLIPRDELRVSASDLKISQQQYYLQDGKAPLPIYTAVRHEIPSYIEQHSTPSQYAWHNTKHFDWFQWFEWTPYEFFCEELECGIPTWAVGRAWNGGKTQWRENGLALPELRTPLMMGIWGSAFCATLSHYYKEVRPILKAAGLGKLDSLLAGKEDDLVKVHPLDPAMIPNFARGLRKRLPATAPESIHEASHLQLMDAGMSNNLPIYPLLRPGRDVDVILAFDASADVRTDNWVKVVDGYVRQRGISGWPMGAGWPPQSNDESKNVKELSDVQEIDREQRTDLMEGSAYLQEKVEDLGYCNIWVGNRKERLEYMDEPPPQRVTCEEDEAHLSSPDAGITLIYFPFLANEKVPGVDPMTSDFMSTWNFVYTPKEIDKVVKLARANYEEGREQTKRTIRAVWERKRKLRLQRQEEEREVTRRFYLRQFGHGHGDDDWDAASKVS